MDRTLKKLLIFMALVGTFSCAKAVPFLTEEILGSSFHRKIEGKPERLQVKVLRQLSAGSSAASCSYHALRNGILIARAALNPEGNDLELLRSAAHMKELISIPNGTWRQLAIQSRLQKLAQKIICKELMRALKGSRIVPAAKASGGFDFNEKTFKVVFDEENPEWSQDELSRILNMMTNISRQFTPEIETDGLHYHFTSDDLREKYGAYIEILLGQLEADDIARPIYEGLYEGGSEKFESYFSQIDIDLVIRWDGTVLKNNKQFKHGCTIGSDLRGEWLTQDETQLILEHERAEGLLQESGIDVAIYGSVVNPVPLNEYVELKVNARQSEEDMSAQELKAFKKQLKEDYPAYKEDIIADQLGEDMRTLKEKIQAQEDFVGLVLVYLDGDVSLSKESSKSFSLNGSSEPASELDYLESLQLQTDLSHWIPLVIVSHEGDRQYIVADSMGNCVRVKDATIKRIISYLEDIEIQDEDEPKVVKKASRTKSSNENESNEESSGSSWISTKSVLTLGATALAGYFIWKTFFTEKPQEEQPQPASAPANQTRCKPAARPLVQNGATP